jgi:hypothetical protein
MTWIDEWNQRVDLLPCLMQKDKTHKRVDYLEDQEKAMAHKRQVMKIYKTSLPLCSSSSYYQI